MTKINEGLKGEFKLTYEFSLANQEFYSDDFWKKLVLKLTLTDIEILRHIYIRPGFTEPLILKNLLDMLSKRDFEERSVRRRVKRLAELWELFEEEKNGNIFLKPIKSVSFQNNIIELVKRWNLYRSQRNKPIGRPRDDVLRYEILLVLSKLDMKVTIGKLTQEYELTYQKKLRWDTAKSHLVTLTEEAMVSKEKIGERDFFLLRKQMTLTGFK